MILGQIDAMAKQCKPAWIRQEPSVPVVKRDKWKEIEGKDRCAQVQKYCYHRCKMAHLLGRTLRFCITRVLRGVTTFDPDMAYWHANVADGIWWQSPNDITFQSYDSFYQSTSWVLWRAVSQSQGWEPQASKEMYRKVIMSSL